MSDGSRRIFSGSSPRTARQVILVRRRSPKLMGRRVAAAAKSLLGLLLRLKAREDPELRAELFPKLRIELLSHLRARRKWQHRARVENLTSKDFGIVARPRPVAEPTPEGDMSEWIKAWLLSLCVSAVPTDAPWRRSLRRHGRGDPYTKVSQLGLAPRSAAAGRVGSKYLSPDPSSYRALRLWSRAR